MKRLLGMLLAGGLCAGCGPDSAGLLINLDILVVTNTDNDFTIAGVSTGINGTRSYSWKCDEGQANITIGATLTAGYIRLQAWDAGGTLVHDNRYEATLLGAVKAFTKSGGTPGIWTLKWTFHNAMWSGGLTVKADTFNDPDAIDIGGTGALDVSWIFQPYWDANPVNINVGGLSGDYIRIRLWDGTGALVYDDYFFGGGGGPATPSGAAGVWTVQIDFNSVVSAGAVTLSQ